MKLIWNALAMVLLGGFAFAVLPAQADLEVSASVQIHAEADFYEPLSANGAWIEVGSYGRCWHPSQVAVDWRPYCYGHWIWTDCGWYWVSDEPWAWACYHYGSWVYDPVHAWVWVPAIEWGPVWVTWRVGGGYIGWAPLAPRQAFATHVTVEPSLFVFVETHRFHEPVRPATVVVNNTTVINKTTQITNIKRETRTIGSSGAQKVVVNEGPGLEPIQKATGQKPRAIPIHEAVRQTPVPPTMARKASESQAKEKPAVAPEQRKATPESKPAPAPAAAPPPKPAPPPSTPGRSIPPDQGRPPSKEEVAPLTPKQPPAPVRPPGKPDRPSKAKDEGKGHDKDQS